jgi:signal transduction histidine kinase
MSRLTTAHALRAAGLAVWGVVTCTHYLGLRAPSASGPMPQLVGFYVSEVATALLLLVFAVGLWINLREAPVERPTGAHLRRLLAQLAAGLLVHTDLMYVVVGQAALVLERRAALRWLAAQTVLLALWAAMLWHLRAFDPLPAFKDAAPALAFGVTLLSLLTWQCFAFCVGWLAAREARQRRAFALVNARLQAAQRELAAKSRLQERLHLSRELHDRLGHHLVALHLQLDLAQRVPPGQREGHVAAGAQIARGMLGEVRRVVGTLREEPAPDLRFELQALQAAVPEPRFHLQCDDDLADLPPAHAHALLRCVQEGVNNVLRHAGAKNLWVGLGASEAGAALSLRDDGAGADAVAPGNGLTGMRERVEALSGSMQVSCSRGRGFAVEILLPPQDGPTCSAS